jgi:hypothetical protein
MAKVNWRQAGAEVGLLALGATIAIGADAWAGARRDQDAERVYLESLREDMEASLEMAAQYVDDNRSSIEAIDDLLSALAAPSGGVSPDSLYVLIERAFWIHTWDPVQARTKT